MDSARQKDLPDFFVLTSVVIGWMVVAFNLAALAGWIFKISFLVALSPHWSPTKPNIVIFALLAGTASALNAPGRRAYGAARFYLCAVVSCAALLMLFQSLTGIATGFDTLFFKTKILIPGLEYSLAVPLFPAINLLFSGLAILLSDYETPKRRYPAQYLALFMVLLSAAGILAQLYGVPDLYFIPLASKLSIHGTLTMFLLGISILFSRPQKGIMRIASSDTLAGTFIRNVIPSGLIVIVAFGWLRWWLERQGIPAFGYDAAIMLAFGILAMFILIVSYIGDVYRLEQQKMLADSLLLENEKKLQAVMDNAASVIVLTDIGRRITFVNRRFEKVFNLPKESALGRPVGDIFPEKAAGTPEAGREIPAGGEASEMEETIATPSGPRTYITCRSPLSDPSGRAYALVYMFTDITDRKAAEEKTLRLNDELTRANKELDAFASSVSHDLRAPLRAIEGLLRIILEDCGPKLDDEGRRLFLRVCGNAVRMSRLIDDMLAFSKFSQSRLEIGPLDMAELAGSVIGEIKSQLSVSGRQVDFEIDELPAASGDGNLIRQVFVNLLENAVKFSAGKKEAFVKVGALRDVVPPVYYVKDNGVGFDMRFSDRLFGVFQRLHSEKDFEGTGVGLAIAQRIITRHGGRIWAEGKPDEGAVFYFTLPEKSR